MRDAVTSLIRNYDTTGRYFDRDAIESLKDYFASGNDRITVAAMINSQSAEIVKAAANSLFEAVPELLLAGGNAYTTRRFSACLRDMDYYLRYGTYALIAGDMDVLNERVLQGLRETYNSLGVPIAPTVRGIQFLKDAIKEMAAAAGIANTAFIDEPFDHMTRELSEVDL
ncbi:MULTISPECIES: allophycocyanin subunit beta [Cyanophyceae]|uniref:Allophycocyanin subunit beta-18 n=1 Tax=Picosynechococcus sp. (strain ATCC 27264 / PCC 7002 / PR-6) TaxID=32049 RepID=APCF_PICP2|nr:MULTISPECIES: allophycocyanin subunit beta [Cyanophyceae]O68967.1 RecName: Full=Allophycocyanin subunit beta-18; Short=Allophycocyanin subunit B18 [Picosynechococcus sp. PCC 7002]7EXT_Q3 Chain Q3, Allophycocyanin subunit beta-18 [Picosynechococcus sp. PCC 7002]7EXT_g3 Chain g3, Allophycocyanin subunit beta-18 [Picosynechococcus sp. PCC 7002]AAC14717.1 allophycocyanin beta-18 subunit [Picosynechococcus sp. PCC 7002]ACA99621.1 allophycocyanin beta-18 subunit [Picosynechococcus sp. PCC 7002]A